MSVLKLNHLPTLESPAVDNNHELFFVVSDDSSAEALAIVCLTYQADLPCDKLGALLAEQQFPFADDFHTNATLFYTIKHQINRAMQAYFDQHQCAPFANIIILDKQVTQAWQQTHVITQFQAQAGNRLASFHRKYGIKSFEAVTHFHHNPALIL